MTTRDAPGALDRELVRAGADVVHVPLIEITAPADGGAALAAALARIDRFDWVVVTSRHGAERVAGPLPGHVRTAAVGTATAAALAAATGRSVDLVPEVQRAEALVAAFEQRGAPDGVRGRVLVAQADRAEPTLATGLRRLGHDVEVVTAYSTRLRTPSVGEVEAALAADAVAFASGSAAEAWATAIGGRTPPVVVAIGPTTARVAREHGIAVTAVADDHSIAGLVARVAATLPPAAPA